MNTAIGVIVLTLLVGLSVLCLLAASIIVIWAMIRGCADASDHAESCTPTEPKAFPANPYLCETCGGFLSETDGITGCRYCSGGKKP